MNVSSSGARLPLALRFLLAARRSEVRGLETLSRICELVGCAGALVHALQKERGYSNVHLERPSDATAAALAGYGAAAKARQEDLLSCLERIMPVIEDTPDKARLLNRVAHVLYRLERLSGLRREVRELRVDVQASTDAYTALIGSLLAVVFEAADSALELDVTRGLVALFNFMQGKELAGQERACGVRGFTAGYFDDEARAHMLQLVEAQQKCFDEFQRHADAPVLAAWTALEARSDELRQLRLMLARTSATQRVSPTIAEVWFDVLTVRMDAMRELEIAMTDALPVLCREAMASVSAGLENHRALARRFAELPEDEPLLFSVQGWSWQRYGENAAGPQLEKSLQDQLQGQARRLEQAGAELEAVRRSLADRKRLDQAKRLLMRSLGLDEQAAHLRLRKMAMEKGWKLDDLARHLIDAHAAGSPSVMLTENGVSDRQADAPARS